jgi:pimeloyl-ACP methyl ester carboxylesterase
VPGPVIRRASRGRLALFGQNDFRPRGAALAPVGRARDTGGMDDDVRPFQLEIPHSAVEDLRDRLRGTRWPDPETVDDWSQGTPLAYARELCRYWMEDYDFTAAQARLNSHPQFITAIDGLDIHFIHVRSPRQDATPLVLTHGWPGSVVEFFKVIGPLTDPEWHGGEPKDAFHVVCPTLPGFGFSGKPAAPGWNVERVADAWAQLMTRLGYPRFGAQGGDWGSLVTMHLGLRHPGQVIGIHLNMVPTMPAQDAAGDDLTDRERTALAQRAAHLRHGAGYAAIQSTRPQTIGYGLVDSPAALAAWITEAFQGWVDHDGDLASVISRDDLLDNIMLYWLPGTGASAARIYWESYRRARLAPVTVPAGCTISAREIYRPSRRWAEPTFPDLRYWNELTEGGHFAAFERPEAFTAEVRAAFATFR